MLYKSVRDEQSLIIRWILISYPSNKIVPYTELLRTYPAFEMNRIRMLLWSIYIIDLVFHDEAFNQESILIRTKQITAK